MLLTRIISASLMITYCQCMQFPLLYQEGVQNVLFSWRRVLSWMLNGFFSALLIFFFCTKAMELQAFDHEGRTAGRDILGTTMFTCVVWVVNLQMALAISYFTLIQHFFIWGSIFFWYIFLLIYGAVPQKYSGNAYKIFVEALAPSPTYWILTFFVVIATLIPYFSYKAIQMRFFPMYHEMVQWRRYERKIEEPEYCDMVQQILLQPMTVSSTGRLAAKANRSMGKDKILNRR